MITYQRYPSLKFTPNESATVPEQLSFEMIDESFRDQLSKSNFEMLSSYPPATRITPTPDGPIRYQHVLISEKMFKLLDGGILQWQIAALEKFYTSHYPSQAGTILYDMNGNPGNHIYLILSEQTTRLLMGLEGQFMSVAMLSGNKIVGYEEGIKIKDGMEILDGAYRGGLTEGDLLFFAATFLSLNFKFEESEMLESELNETNEKVYHIK